MSDVEISKVKIKVGDIDIELSVEQAKKLKVCLEELFGKEIIREVVHDHSYHWWYTGPPYLPPTYTTPSIPVTPTPIWYSSIAGGITTSVSGNTLSITC